MSPLPNLDEALLATNLAQPSTGRVVALVGPTGVGKTTTIAKLAARAALVENKRVAIVTLDTYRVGGEEQIRTFADLMGVPLHLVTDPNELGAKLEDLHRMDQVFVDSPGNSPRDAMAIRVLENAFAGTTGSDVEVHLTVPANLPVLAIESILRRYRPLGPVRLLFTKLDEADDLACLVHGPARLGLPVSFLATGQRVPEDLEDATHERLAELAKNGLDSEAVAA
jgi:flagellar biosynthesis protein FlhF